MHKKNIVDKELDQGKVTLIRAQQTRSELRRPQIPWSFDQAACIPAIQELHSSTDLVTIISMKY